MALEPNNDDVTEETLLPTEGTANDEVIAETSSPAEESDKEEILTTTAAPPESRFRRTLRLSIRWVLGFLIVFALGFMTAVLLLYIPIRDEKSQLETERSQAEAKAEARIDTLESDIVSLENEIKDYKAREDELEAEIENLQAELTNANLHIRILSGLSDINAARVSLENEDAAEAQVYLSNTMDTLEILSELVDSEQRDKVVAMQNRLELVLTEIEAEPSVALSDLQVLANSLTVLENTFFAKP
jgi:septal ring factor EnvC (AmiA/AmiB activator)